MSWLPALTTGAGLGLIYFGGLWLTVRQVARTQRKMVLAVSGVARLALAIIVFHALMQYGVGMVLAALAGFWLARLCMLWRLGGIHHGE
jgi:F1F0 ATPase subunit 2